MIKNQSRVVILIYMIGFLLGIVYMNMSAGEYISSMGIFNRNFAEQFQKTDIKGVQYLGISSAACFTRDYSCADRNDTLSQNWFNCISGMDGHTLRRVFYMCGNESRS